MGRFITADDYPSTGQGLNGNNMFAYCGNNPVSREDYTGCFWDTVFDVASLCMSIVEVAANPADIWAWVGLAGDVVDLVPFVSGVGEVTKAIGASAKAADNVIDAAKLAYKNADAASDLKSVYGSYEIIYKSGKNYVGKGSFQRAINSAERYVNKYGDEVASISWKSAPTERASFIDEYYRMMKRGVNNANTYNQIWSPGRRYLMQDMEQLLK
jgi:hypothetical protein